MSVFFLILDLTLSLMQQQHHQCQSTNKKNHESRRVKRMWWVKHERILDFFSSMFYLLCTRSLCCDILYILRASVVRPIRNLPTPFIYHEIIPNGAFCFCTFLYAIYLAVSSYLGVRFCRIVKTHIYLSIALETK